MKRLQAIIAALIGLFITSIAAAQAVTTVISHGYSLDGTKGIWVEAMADAIVARAGAGAVLRYQQDTGRWRVVSGSLSEQQPTVLIYRWIDDFDKAGPNLGYAEAAGDALYAALRDPRFENQAGELIEGIELIDKRDLHLIAHSRGVCVISETARRLGTAGITVDHMTGLDPHPVNGTLDPPYDLDWGDPMPRRWSNVTFADVYWRADGGGFINGLDFDGIPIDNAMNVELDEDALNCCAYSYAHLDTHLWYHGTIDLSPGACDGEHCITQQMRDTWWPDGDATSGFYFSIIGGGADQRPGLPPGIAPQPAPLLFNGDFADQMLAGWLYHGGSIASSAVVTENSATFLKLGPQTAAAATHNRFHLDDSVSSLAMSINIFTADARDVLTFTLLDQDEIAWEVGNIALDEPTGAWQSVELPLPTSIPAGTYRLHIEVAAGDGAVAAEVGIDDIVLDSAACPADIVGDDSVVDTADLLTLLSGWGGDGPAAAIAEPADIVDTADLLALLAAWGPCH